MDYQIVSRTPKEKGKVQICLDNGEIFDVYKGEAYRLSLFENNSITEEQYQQILQEVLGKRATKYAMHLLERQERTEKQLRDKLEQQGYPKSCVEQAIAYVKSYHYIDDFRYASVYIRYHQEKESRQKLTMKLLMRGVSREDIELALEEEYQSDESAKIEEILRKKHYNTEEADEAAYRKMVQFLLRRGFRSSDIYRVIGRYTYY